MMTEMEYANHCLWPFFNVSLMFLQRCLIAVRHVLHRVSLSAADFFRQYFAKSMSLRWRIYSVLVFLQCWQPSLLVRKNIALPMHSLHVQHVVHEGISPKYHLCLPLG